MIASGSVRDAPAPSAGSQSLLILGGVQCAVQERDVLPNWVYLAVFFMVIALSWTATRLNGLYDDAYITATYARNIAHGLGWVFSAHSAPTYGTTAPLWTLVLAVTQLLHLPISVAAVALNAVCYAIVSTASCRLAAGLAGKIGVAICFVVSVAFILLLPLAQGMETPLYCALVVGALLAWHLDRAKLALLIAGLVPLVRGDGMLLLGVMGLMALREHRVRELLPFGLLALIPAGAWELFAYWQFHLLVPSSFLAKHAQSADVSGKINVLSFLWLVWPQALLLLPLAAAGGIAARRDSCVQMIIVWAATYEIFYSFVAHVPPMTWYMLPLWWVLPVLVGIGGARILRGFSWRRRLNAVGLAVSTACLLAALAPVPAKFFFSAAHSANISPVYREAASYLASHPPGAVAAAEVGVLGYYSGDRVIDMLGLTSPEVIPHLASQDYLWVVRRDRPRYMFTWLPPTHGKCIYRFTCIVWSSTWFRKHYQTVRLWPYRGDLRYAILQFRP